MNGGKYAFQLPKMVTEALNVSKRYFFYYFFITYQAKVFGSREYIAHVQCYVQPNPVHVQCIHVNQLP